jgi:hypothetical protein
MRTAELAQAWNSEFSLRESIFRATQPLSSFILHPSYFPYALALV